MQDQEHRPSTRGLNWGFYCCACSHFYYGTRECPIHQPPFETMVRETLIDILRELKRI